MAARRKAVPPKELTDSIPVTPEEVRKPEFKDFAPIQVPLGPVRMEIAELQKNGLDYLPLSDFLRIIHKAVKEDSGSGYY